MGRRIWVVAIGLLALLPILDAVLWQIAIGRLKSGFDAWAVGAQAADWSVSRGKAVPGGWPLAATLRIDNVRLSGGEMVAPNGVTWIAPRLVLRISLMHPRSLEIEAVGEQHLRAGVLPEAALTGERLLVVASLGAGGQPDAVEIMADRAKLVTNTAWSASAERIQVHVSGPPPRPSAETSLKFAFSAEAVTLPGTVRWPLGSSIARLEFDGTMDGPLAPARPPTAWATAWRDGGGVVQVQNLVLDWGPLSLTGSATLALDDQLQPMGAGTSRVTGYAATLDALARDGALTRSAATAAKAVLSLMAGSPDSGATDDVDVPLTLQYRTLSMRQVPLLRLPELDWP